MSRISGVRRCRTQSNIPSFTSLFLQSVADVDLESLGSLEYLDLSRNLIQEIQPGTFLGMANLKGLDFSVNVVRKVRTVNLRQTHICR